MLQASAADESLINCYQDLTKQLALALRHENKRCDYLDQQKNLMMAIQEEATTVPEGGAGIFAMLYVKI